MPCAKLNALSTGPHLILQVALRGRYSDPCKHRKEEPYSSHAGGERVKSRLLTPRNPPQLRSSSPALKAERSGMPWGNQSARQKGPLLCRMMEASEGIRIPHL